MQTFTPTSTRLDQEEIEDRSLGEVLSDLSTHGQALMRGEVLRVKRETKDSLKTHALGIGLGAGAAVMGLVAVILVGHTIAWALAEAMPQWAAYLITTALYVAAAAVLALKAKAALTARPVAPVKAINDTKEDLQWIQTHR